MELRSFSNQAIDAVGQQALHHIFYAKNFRKNLEEVINFEQEQGVYLHHLIDIWYYLLGISEDNLYMPIVRQNVERYIRYYWLKHRVVPLEKFYMTDKILKGNREIFLKDFPSFAIWKEKACFESLRSRKFLYFFASHKKITQEVLDFYFSMFGITTAIMSEEKKEFLRLICDDQFLSYCNYLINHRSPLMLENEYFFKVREVLEANMDYTFTSAPHAISGTFFEENERVLKRVNELNPTDDIYR